jgi:hypothetical protein
MGLRTVVRDSGPLAGRDGSRGRGCGPIDRVATLFVGPDVVANGDCGLWKRFAGDEIA